MDPTVVQALREVYADRLRENVPLAGYTSARIGGPADVVIIAHSADELVEATTRLWQLDIHFVLIGGGCNVLVSDRGVRGVVLLNRARQVNFSSETMPPTVKAESGANLNDIAQRAARLGLSGFEWAASVPGTLGGAVYGNAGAFGGEMANNLATVDILHREHGLQTWAVEKLAYGYRNSNLKREHQPALILSATLNLSHGETAAIQAKMAEFAERRRRTQPPGASMGSMFKNPPGDKAGRLIEAAGLKGTRIGTAEISTRHANFFINTDSTRAEDMRQLLELTQRTVREKFSVQLETEIEMIGDW